MQMCQTVDPWVQVEDSKVEQMIYVMWKVKLKLNLQNEQISIRNTREIHEISKNSKNKHFKVTLPTSWSFLQFLTDSQPLDITPHRGILHLSLSQPLHQPVLLGVEPLPQCFF